MDTIYRGVVKGNVVVLDRDVWLPEEAIVEVRIVPQEEPDVFARVLEQRAANTGYRVDIDEILAEDRSEREEASDTWMSPDRDS